MRRFDKAHNARKYILPLDSSAPDSRVRETVANMYAYLDDYMNTLTLELVRIEETDHKLDEIADRPVEKFEERVLFTYLWADYYFFLNTVERTYRLVQRLYKSLGEEEKAEKIKAGMDWENIRSIRNGIEHLDERITRSNGEEFYTQHRSMDEEKEISIDGSTFAANEDSLQLLYQIYDDISNIIEQKYIEPNRETVDKIWSDMGRHAAEPDVNDP